MRSIAWTFSGFTLNPSLVTMNPRNLPSSILNEHFPGLSFMLTLRRVCNVLSISLSMVSSSMLMTTRSSI
ncbi:hypothetical protein Hanom_Chr11g01024551 [Helianthus anomalus]